MENFSLQVAVMAGGMVLAFFVLLLILIVLFSPLAGRTFTGWYIMRVPGFVIDRYWEDLLAIDHLLKKKSSRRLPRAYLGNFFSARGHLRQISSGRKRPKSPWEKLLFNPVYLRHLPGYDHRLVGTGVVIGPYSRRPLSLKIPILLGGMAYKTLSAPAKQALALGATMAGTAANTGSGPFLPVERAAAEKLIVQYSRGQWGKDLEALLQADAVEIQLGQGLWGSASREKSSRHGAASLELREILELKPGEKTVIPPRVSGIKNPAELAELIENLRQKTGGVPVGVKVGGTGRLEEELDLILRAGPDFLAVTGMEGGVWDGGAESSGLLSSKGKLPSMGIPTFHLLVRARRFLEERKLCGKITLLAGGGLVTPMDFLKAMALGADAVFIGFAALVALVHPQAPQLFSRRLPMDMLFYRKKEGSRLHISQAAGGLEHFLKAAVAEMQTAALGMGKNHLREVAIADLSAADQELAAYLGIDWCGRWAEWPQYSQSRG